MDRLLGKAFDYVLPIFSLDLFSGEVKAFDTIFKCSKYYGLIIDDLSRHLETELSEPILERYLMRYVSDLTDVGVWPKMCQKDMKVWRKNNRPLEVMISFDNNHISILYPSIKEAAYSLSIPEGEIYYTLKKPHLVKDKSYSVTYV